MFVTEIALCIAYVSLFVFMIRKLPFFKIDGISHNKLVLAFLVKVVSGILLGAIYTYYYKDRLTSDTFKFFDDSKIMFNVMFENPKWFLQMFTGWNDAAAYLLPYYDTMHNWYNKAALFNDYRTQIRINTLLRFISLGFYNVHGIIFSFLAFIGLTALLKLFIGELQNKRNLLYAGVYFLPSVVFWGSGLLKDSLIFFATGISLYHLHKLFIGKGKNPMHFFWFVVFFLFLMVIKFHNYILLVPLFFAYSVCLKWPRYKVLVFSGTIAVYYLVLIKIYYILPGYGLLDLLAKKQLEFLVLADYYHPPSQIAISELSSSMWNALTNTPEALYHTLFRPWFWESQSPFIMLAGFENLVICFLLIACVLGFDRKKLKITPLLLLSFFYFISLYELIGLVTPVMGAMVRYKAQALPFIIFVFVSLADPVLLKTRLHRMRLFFFSGNQES